VTFLLYFIADVWTPSLTAMMMRPKKIPVLPVASGKKSRDRGGNLFLFLFHDMPYNITQQLIKTN